MEPGIGNQLLAQKYTGNLQQPRPCTTMAYCSGQALAAQGAHGRTSRCLPSPITFHQLIVTPHLKQVVHGQVVQEKGVYGQVVQERGVHGQVVQGRGVHGQVVRERGVYGQVVQERGALAREGCIGVVCLMYGF